MTFPRSALIDLNATAYYHCMTRCVRRSYLCGKDYTSGRDFTHRKHWIVSRLKQLAEIFAIRVCAYAVMSNHYHLVLCVDEAQAQQWQEDEVKARWEKIFAGEINRLAQVDTPKPFMQRKIAQWRQRLTSISWFMRCLNEPLARLSNKEDECKGRFWEGRFKSQALLDEGAVLSAMAYVDLNPIRANLADTPETSDFTSIQERIQCLSKQLKAQPSSGMIENTKQPPTLMPFESKEQSQLPCIDFKLQDYLELVETTGKVIRGDKKGVIPEGLTSLLTRLNLSQQGWFTIVTQLEQQFYAAIGNEIVMLDFGYKTRSRPPRGINAAKRCYLSSAA